MIKINEFKFYYTSHESAVMSHNNSHTVNNEECVLNGYMIYFLAGTNIKHWTYSGENRRGKWN